MIIPAIEAAFGLVLSAEAAEADAESVAAATVELVLPADLAATDESAEAEEATADSENARYDDARTDATDEISADEADLVGRRPARAERMPPYCPLLAVSLALLDDASSVLVAVAVAVASVDAMLASLDDEADWEDGVDDSEAEDDATSLATDDVTSSGLDLVLELELELADAASLLSKSVAVADCESEDELERDRVVVGDADLLLLSSEVEAVEIAESRAEVADSVEDEDRVDEDRKLDDSLSDASLAEDRAAELEAEVDVVDRSEIVDDSVSESDSDELERREEEEAVVMVEMGEEVIVAEVVPELVLLRWRVEVRLSAPDVVFRVADASSDSRFRWYTA